MVAANSVTVAVAAGANHFQVMVAKSDAGRDRQRAPVQRMHSISVHIARQIRGTADAADDTDLMRLKAELKQSRLKRGQHGEIAAARSPIRMEPAAVRLFG